MHPFVSIILSVTERLRPLAKVVKQHIRENLTNHEREGSHYTYAVIRDQLQYCQNGGDSSPCSSYCNVPEGTHYHGASTFAPETTSSIASYLQENNIHVAAHVGAEGYHRFPTTFSFAQGLAELKPETADYIMEYYDRVLHQPIRFDALMTGTDLAIVKDAILKDREMIVHRPTNGVELMRLGEYGRNLLPLIAHFVDHLTFSYHFPWQPESEKFAKQNAHLNKYLDLMNFSSHYTTTKFLRVVTRDRTPVQTLALADRVLQKGRVFFDYTIHDGKGQFSTSNQEAIPTQDQLEKIHLGLMGRLIFFNQMIETNLDYLTMTPAFGQNYINCGGHDKAVFVVRALEDGTPVQDTCSEMPTGMAFPTAPDDPQWIQAQDDAAHSCGNCRQMCESPFRWNRDLRTQRPLTAYMTLTQLMKALNAQRNEDFSTSSNYKRQNLQDVDFISKLLKARAIMVEDRFNIPYWRTIAADSGLSDVEIDNVVRRYHAERNDPSVYAEIQKLEQEVATISPGPYEGEPEITPTITEKVKRSVWEYLVLNPREELVTYAPARAYHTLFRRSTT